MKANRIFLMMIGLSAALHGLALAGTAGIGFHASPPVPEASLVSTLKMIRTRQPAAAPLAPSPPSKPVEPVPEIPPEPPRETAYSGDAQEEAGTEELADGAYSGDTPESGSEKDGGTITAHEYDALLAYIKDFIDKNLVYPQMARRRNAEGVVAVRFEIGASGMVGAVVTERSSGSSILDNAAVSLVKKMPPPKRVKLTGAVALNVNIEYKLTE